MTIVIPENWQTLTKEAETFLTTVANKYVAIPDKSLPVLKEFINEVTTFINSELGADADAATKEVQLEILEFIEILFADLNIIEEDIIVMWQEQLYK
jgi:hypothetical protein